MARSSLVFSAPSGSRVRSSRTSNARTQCDQQPDYRSQHPDAASQLEDFRLKPRGVHVQDLRRHDRCVFATQPAEGGRARDAEFRNDVGIADGPDKVA